MASFILLKIETKRRNSNENKNDFLAGMKTKPKCLEIVKVFILFCCCTFIVWHVLRFSWALIFSKVFFNLYNCGFSIYILFPTIFCELQTENVLCQECDWVGFNWTFFSFETVRWNGKITKTSKWVLESILSKTKI